ncbi:hypothetical protein [Rhizorhabdus sp.]|uniref:hypothetical protein n=1 Tax=Rhizorhabdus sp. TaxID=1968843 RepID=UPI0035B1CC75
MHPRIFDDIGRFYTDGPPDLTVGRSLEDALARLDAIAFAEGDIPTGWMEYADAWLEELRDFAGFAASTYDRDGTHHLTLGLPCDGQERERRRRLDALCDHMHARSGAREAIAHQLEREGHVTDSRPVVIRDLVAAAREFIRTGGELLVHPNGRPEVKADLELILGGDDLPAADAHWQAAAALCQLERRPSAQRALRRIATFCGKRLDNGWIVFSSRPAEAVA